MTQDSKKVYEVKGLIVKLTPSSRFLDAYYGEHSPEPVVRVPRGFDALVSYLPPGRENDMIRDELREGRPITIVSFIPGEELDRAAHYPGTITFEHLDLRIDMAERLYASDPRPACVIPGTPEHIEHVHHTRRQIFNEASKNPCDNCNCRIKKAPGPQIC